MINSENKNLWIGGAVVLVIVLGIIFWTKNKAVAPAVNENVVPVTVAPDKGAVSTLDALNNISYAKALIKYKNARLQLEKTCQATPNHMTFKNGAYLMIDNRAGVARTIRVGSLYKIKAYGFRIVRLSVSKVPTTWLVDCDKYQNVATILIQK